MAEYNLKAWALCLLRKSNMISKEGVFHLDVALAGIPDKERIAVEKKIDECLYVKERKPEEIAWHFLKCYHQDNPKHSYISENTITLASSKHLMEDDHSQPSTSKISEDHDDGSFVTTLTSIMDTKIRNESLLSSSIKDAFDRVSSNKDKEINS
ncbi:unnamed protein product [Parnassius apollo]|uniref:(apollo) hypothetical protein n=1 Tax=Parnassius apollo TaxID=110799 RepID=A0A8S3WE68_PARAO|nr:unnamed protein product [Parnassius apollo]